jgi:hypothetical protein
MFVSENLNFSNSYRIFVNVSDLPRPLPLPNIDLERVRFEIDRISKKGEVKVKIKPQVTNRMLIQ